MLTCCLSYCNIRNRRWSVHFESLRTLECRGFWKLSAFYSPFYLSVSVILGRWELLYDRGIFMNCTSESFLNITNEQSSSTYSSLGHAVEFSSPGKRWIVLLDRFGIRIFRSGSVKISSQ